MTAALRAREATGSMRPKRMYGLLKCVPEAVIPDTPLRLINDAESQSTRAPGRKLRARRLRRILSAISKIVSGQ